MSARILDGKAISEAVLGEVGRRAQTLRETRGVQPGLAVILVGDNPASQVYVRSKHQTCERMGFLSVVHHLPADSSQETVATLIAELNADRRIHGILLQTPVPDHLDEQALLERIDPRKDVDGLHPANAGRLALGQPGFVPCTPLGVRELLARSGIDPAGRLTVIVGRSTLVGRPLALLLLRKEPGSDSTVCVCHSRTPDLAALARQADILVAAIGRARFITGDMIKPGAVVVDVGINRIEDSSKKSGYRIVGDVDFEAACEVAGAITPVPGGVGPMTIAMLLSNTVQAAEAQSQGGTGCQPVRI